MFSIRLHRLVIYATELSWHSQSAALLNGMHIYIHILLLWGLHAGGRLAWGANDVERYQILQVLLQEGLAQVGYILPVRRLCHLLPHKACVKPGAWTQALSNRLLAVLQLHSGLAEMCTSEHATALSEL